MNQKNSGLGISAAVLAVLFLFPLAFLFAAIDILRNDGNSKKASYFAIGMCDTVGVIFSIPCLIYSDSVPGKNVILTFTAIFLVSTFVLYYLHNKQSHGYNSSQSVPPNVNENTGSTTVNRNWGSSNRVNVHTPKTSFSTPRNNAVTPIITKNNQPKTPNDTSYSSSSFRQARVFNIDNATLANQTIANRMVHNTTTDEVVFAESAMNRMRGLLSSYGVSANVNPLMAKCGNVCHPMIEIDNRQYGSIGIMINKNMMLAIRLRYGQVSEMMARQQILRDSSDGYNAASKWNAVGTAGSAIGLGSSLFREHDAFNPFDGCGVAGCSAFLGTFNCLSGIAHRSKAKRMQKEADRIEYDPSELAFEQMWEQNVMRCFNQL